MAMQSISRCAIVLVLCILSFAVFVVPVQAGWSWTYVDDFWTDKAKIASDDHSAFYSGGFPQAGYLKFEPRQYDSGRQLSFYRGYNSTLPDPYLGFHMPFAPAPIVSGTMRVDVRSIGGTFGYLDVTVGTSSSRVTQPGIYDFSVSDSLIKFSGNMAAIARMTVTLQLYGERTRISQIKSKPDNEWISLSSKVITRWFWDGAYIEEEHRSAAICVNNAPYAHQAEMIDVTGCIIPNDGHRIISVEKCIPLGVYADTKPLGMTNKSIMSPAGLSCRDLLVKVWGTIIPEDYTYFYVDDGSGNRVRCQMAPGLMSPEYCTFVSVTGVSSTELMGVERSLVVKVGAQEDVVPF